MRNVYWSRPSMCLCICVSACPSPHSHTTAWSRMQVGEMAGVPSIGQIWNSCMGQHRAEREMSASACTRFMPAYHRHHDQGKFHCAYYIMSTGS